MTWSVYLRNGTLQSENGYASTPDEAFQLNEFIDRLLRDSRVVLPQAVVVDVGVMQNGEWAVVEANAAWGSGIYGCDPNDVLEVLRHAATKLS